MKKCHGGLDTIMATVMMVVLVVFVIITAVLRLTRDSGSTLNQSVGIVSDVQNNTQVSDEVPNVIKFDKATGKANLT